MKKQILAIVFLISAVWLLYGRAGGFEFLRLDDHDYTFRCLFVRDGLSWANVAEAFANARHAAIWMPATYIAYMADVSFFGGGAAAHHCVNVAIHALNAVLFFLLLLSVFRRNGNGGAIWFSVIAAAFWALHPQRAEAVAWVAGRKELLCAFFTLAGLIAWVRLSGRKRTFSAFACCALACMSKPTGMCFPFLLLAVNLATGDQSPTTDGQSPTTDDEPPITAYALCFAIAIATGALAVYSQTHPEGLGNRALFTGSLAWRVLNAAASTGLYIYHMIVPVGVHLDYAATPGRFPAEGMTGLVTLGAVCAATGLCAWRVRSSRRVIVAAALFFFAALAPTLGIFGSFGEHARADRFFYLPSMAVVGLLVTGHRSLVTAHRSPLTKLITALMVVTIYAITSWPVIASYKNDYTAFSRTLKFEPENGRALAHVASEECARFGHIDKGIELYRKSQAVRPRDDTAAQLAYTLALRGLSSDYDEIRRLCAKFACDHSLDRKGMALEALGATAMRQRKWKEAISCLEDSVRAPARFYSADDAKLRLGACYANVRRTADAIRIFEPLTQSSRTDIASRAARFLQTLKANPNAIVFF